MQVDRRRARSEARHGIARRSSADIGTAGWSAFVRDR
jgi:hypothetical protein